jgi:hypothetical protein
MSASTRRNSLAPRLVVDDITSTFQPLIGPPDKRVLLLTNAKLSSPSPASAATISFADGMSIMARARKDGFGSSIPSRRIDESFRV